MLAEIINVFKAEALADGVAPIRRMDVETGQSWRVHEAGTPHAHGGTATHRCV
jgi:hypothetical protein